MIIDEETGEKNNQAMCYYGYACDRSKCRIYLLAECQPCVLLASDVQMSHIKYMQIIALKIKCYGKFYKCIYMLSSVPHLLCQGMAVSRHLVSGATAHVHVDR